MEKKIIDDEGNYIIANKGEKVISLSIKLQSESYKRKIGRIDIQERILYIERKREKHLLRKLGAYGLCYKIIQDGKTFDWVRLSDNYEEWKIPRSFLLEAKCLHFVGNGGFELQVFISLENIKQFKI